jgi:UDP-N-acetylglucosamine 4-epimerase
MIIFVTGGAGFIGSRLVHALLEEGHNVTVFDNFSTDSGHMNLIKSLGSGLTIIEGDITDYDLCLEACHGKEVIYHLAAMKSVPESLQYPLEYNDVNIGGTVNMLEAARRSLCVRFIYASSSAVYGKYESNTPILETLPLSPISPYAVTKMAGEGYCRSYAYNYGIRTYAMRFFNVYGPGQDVSDGYAGVISKFISAMVKGQRPKILGDGKQVRDFVYITDVIEALMRAGLYKHYVRDFEAFNVGSGRARNLLEIIDIVNKQLMTHIEPEFLPAQEGDIRSSVGEINKAEMYLAYKPQVKFPNGLLETIRFFQEKSNV